MAAFSFSPSSSPRAAIIVFASPCDGEKWDKRKPDRLGLGNNVTSAARMATVGIVVLWRCKCGAHIKVIGEAEQTHPRASQMAACPKCGEKQLVHAEKILSIAEDYSDVSPSLDTNDGV
jgi:hypothetical protein